MLNSKFGGGGRGRKEGCGRKVGGKKAWAWTEEIGVWMGEGGGGKGGLGNHRHYERGLQQWGVLFFP